MWRTHQKARIVRAVNRRASIRSPNDPLELVSIQDANPGRRRFCYDRLGRPLGRRRVVAGRHLSERRPVHPFDGFPKRRFQAVEHATRPLFSYRRTGYRQPPPGQAAIAEGIRFVIVNVL